MSEILSLIKEQKLSPDTKGDKVEWVVPEMLAKRTISIWWAKGKSGKTLFSYAFLRHVQEHFEHMLYVDYDNPSTVLEQRKVKERLICTLPNLHYCHRSTVKMGAQDMHNALVERAVGKAYNGWLIVYDSIKNFIDPQSARMPQFMETLMQLRDAGATIIGLHHGGKSGEVFEGHVALRDMSDTVYCVDKRPGPWGQLHSYLKVDADRLPIKDQAWIVELENYELLPWDSGTAKLEPAEKEFVNAAMEQLGKHDDGLKQGELLKLLGKRKDDRTAMAWLKKHAGTYWGQKDGKGRAKIYTKTIGESNAKAS